MVADPFCQTEASRKANSSQIPDHFHSLLLIQKTLKTVVCVDVHQVPQQGNCSGYLLQSPRVHNKHNWVKILPRTNVWPSCIPQLLALSHPQATKRTEENQSSMPQVLFCCKPLRTCKELVRALQKLTWGIFLLTQLHSHKEWVVVEGGTFHGTESKTVWCYSF